MNGFSRYWLDNLSYTIQYIIMNWHSTLINPLYNGTIHNFCPIIIYINQMNALHNQPHLCPIIGFLKAKAMNNSKNHPKLKRSICFASITTLCVGFWIWRMENTLSQPLKGSQELSPFLAPEPNGSIVVFIANLLSGCSPIILLHLQTCSFSHGFSQLFVIQKRL